MAREQLGKAPRRNRQRRNKESIITAMLQAGPLSAVSRTASAVLARTKIYRRLPVGVRCRLDSHILLRPPGCQTLEQLSERFELEKRHGVSQASLKEYAEKLEQLVRPVMTSEVIAGVLGCLPEEYRQQLLAGSQVMLVSRAIQALTDEQSAGALPVADLAKLATILGSVAGRFRSAAGTKSPRGAKQCAEPEYVTLDEKELAEAVRRVYGIFTPTS